MGGGGWVVRGEVREVRDFGVGRGGDRGGWKDQDLGTNNITDRVPSTSWTFLSLPESSRRVQ